MCELKKRLEIDGKMFSLFNSEPYDRYEQAVQHSRCWALSCGDFEEVKIVKIQDKYAVYYR